MRGCKTDWKGIQKVDSGYLWVVGQSIGKFVFLFVPFQVFYNEYGIFLKLCLSSKPALCYQNLLRPWIMKMVWT